MSNVRGSAEAIARTQTSITHLFQRTDADHVSVDPTRTELTGTGGRFEIGKGAVGNWRYNVGGNWRSPELELNDIGILICGLQLFLSIGSNYFVFFHN